MKLRKIFFTAVLFFSSICLSAQNSRQEISSHNISSLESALSLLAKNKIQRGDFSLKKYSFKTERTINSSGTFVISSENGIIWFTQKPIVSVQAMTKNTAITKNSRGKISKIDGSENPVFLETASLTAAIFNGDISTIKEKCECEFSNEKNNWTLSLKPKDKSISAVLEKIIVLACDKKITSIKMLHTTGDFSEYELRNHKFADTLNDDETALFTY